MSVTLLYPSTLTVFSAYRGTSAVPYSSSIACSTVVRISAIVAAVHVRFGGFNAVSSASVNTKSPTTSTNDDERPLAGARPRDREPVQEGRVRRS